MIVEVILLEDVPSLGKRDELVTVKDGYARNYLMPRGLAVKATQGAIRQARQRRESVDSRADREQRDAEALAAKLSGVVVRIGARAGEGGRLFGSVTTKEIAERLAQEQGVDVDRRRFGLDDPLKELGKYEVSLRLHPSVTATIQVEVYDEQEA